MRLIDADALIPMMKYATTDSEIGVFPIKIGFNDIEKVINEQPTVNTAETDLISRQAAIDALWKALYEYEDETEQKFQASDELNTDDWFMHRIFVQNMSDIDRQTILNLPSAQPEIIRCKECLWRIGRDCTRFTDLPVYMDDYCGRAKRRGEHDATD